MNNRISILLIIYLLLFSIISTSIIPLSKADTSNKWLNENTYQAKEGVIEVYSGSMAYFDSNTNSYQKIDTSIQQNLTDYFAEKGIYKFYISKFFKYSRHILLFFSSNPDGLAVLSNSLRKSSSFTSI